MDNNISTYYGNKYNTYVGARYVPKILSDWDATVKYDPLTVVLYQGSSYTSKTFVPKGVLPTDERYWALTGNYNAQVEQYRQEVIAMKKRITNVTFAFLTIADLMRSQNVQKGDFCYCKENNTLYLIDNEASGSSIELLSGVFAIVQVYEVVTPEMFGAKGDGVTNDSAALTYAFSTGKVVLFSFGKKYLTDTNIVLSRSQEVRGQGVSSKKADRNDYGKYPAATILFTGTGFAITTNDSNLISDLRIECTTGGGISTARTTDLGKETNAVLRNVTVVLPDQQGTCFQIGQVNTAYGSGNSLINCTAKGGRYGYNVYGSDNLFSQCQGDSATYGAKVYNFQNMFDQCQIFNSYYAVLSINRAVTCVFNSCSFDQFITDRAKRIVEFENECDSISFTSCRMIGLQSLINADATNKRISFVNCMFENGNTANEMINFIDSASPITIMSPLSHTINLKTTFGSVNTVTKLLPEYTLSGNPDIVFSLDSQKTNESGIYQIGEDTTAPDGTGYGLLVTFNTGRLYKAQLYIASANGKTYSRVWNGTVWGSWISYT